MKNGGGIGKISYKIEVRDEYIWSSHHLRFATEAEAEECSHHLGGAGWFGIQDLRIVQSNEPVNARWADQGILDTNGKPISISY